MRHLSHLKGETLIWLLPLFHDRSLHDTFPYGYTSHPLCSTASCTSDTYFNWVSLLHHNLHCLHLWFAHYHHYHLSLCLLQQLLYPHQVCTDKVKHAYICYFVKKHAAYVLKGTLLFVIVKVTEFGIISVVVHLFLASPVQSISLVAFSAFESLLYFMHFL